MFFLLDCRFLVIGLCLIIHVRIFWNYGVLTVDCSVACGLEVFLLCGVDEKVKYLLCCCKFCFDYFFVYKARIFTLS